MINYLDPYKTRTYPLLVGDFSNSTFAVSFDDGIFIPVEEEKALYLYANFTEITPPPFRKYKPEEFNASCPIVAALVLHSDDYTKNVKDGEKWKKEKVAVGIVEKAIANYILGNSSYILSPIKGNIDFMDNKITQKAFLGSNKEDITYWLHQMIDIELTNGHIYLSEIPAIGTKKQFKGDYKINPHQQTIEQIYREREQFLIWIIGEFVDIDSTEFEKEISTKPALHVALEALKELSITDPAYVKLACWAITQIMR
ncbi:MAG: hypothetical protein DSM107014_12935 [Gomphosphaeria aponina SAG 52.96 = DSM 107014]|uniref:Uncharacterized protein n=1 Tax=Gomphosphaeria aponina SAG 52.96 = DSM 107014 TaxID=1521640 RepID=A0A941GSQ7_9CHRO|nr:hypothetical protein [Gomphosphaeria aponina SAG 52.96 = DSM 107014]